MGLKIIYGEPGSGKSTYCFNEIVKLIDTEKKIYIITPEQFSFTAEQKLMEIIGEQKGKKAVTNAEVITLSRMAHRVLGEVGGVKNVKLSKCGKAMLIYSILREKNQELKFLGKTDENIDLGMRTITELKKHGISTEILKNEIEKTDDMYLKTKLSDINLIYEEFQNKIEGKYIEENDLLTLLEEKIEQTDFAKDSVIFIDEFTGFTLQEYKIIQKLINQAKQVNVTVCTDNLELNTNPDKDIYYSNKTT